MHLTHLQLATIKDALKQDSTISSPTLDESLNCNNKRVSTSSAQNCTFLWTEIASFSSLLNGWFHAGIRTTKPGRKAEQLNPLSRCWLRGSVCLRQQTTLSARAPQNAYGNVIKYTPDTREPNRKWVGAVVAAWHDTDAFSLPLLLKGKLSTSHKSTNMSQCRVG